MTPTTPTALRRTLTVVGSLATAAVLLIGVPFALWRMAGWPLPTTMPSPGDLGRAMTRASVSDAVIVKTLAVVGWGAWLMLVWSVIVEVWARLRGRPSPSRRFAGPFQDLARRIVTAASLLTVTGAPLMNASPAFAGVGAPALVVERSAQPPAIVPSPTIPIAAQLAADATPASNGYTVQRRDSLWRIAECQLGDPMRWREIWDLNRGRRFDGVAFTDADLIQPGWELDLPQSAIAPEPPSVIAETPVTTPASPPSSDAPQATIAPPTTGPPITTADATTTTVSERTSDTVAPENRAETGTPSANKTSSADTGDDDESHVPMFIGGTALATGLLLMLRRLRRTQARRRRPGEAPHRPSPATAPVETAIRHDADVDRMERAFVALRAFAAGIDAGSLLPELAAARIGSEEIEVLLGSPTTANPPGFEDRGEYRVFATETSISTAALVGLAGDTATPWPAVVSAGGLNADLVLIDLETAGVLTVDGPRAGDTIRRIATELAVSPATELVDVLVLGERAALDTGDRVRRVGTLDEAITALDAAQQSTRAAVDLLGAEDTPTARRNHSAEHGWGVTVLVCSDPLDGDGLERLAQVVQTRAGVAAVVLSEPRATGWSLTVGEESVLHPHGFVLTPLGLPQEDLEALEVLLADATVGDAEAALLGSSTEQAGPDEPIFVSDTAVVEPDGPVDDHDVEVRVLGPVDVHGVDLINRRRTVEVIAYLALHPKGVSASQIKTALWRESMPSQDTFNVTIHRARAALGLDRDGTHHLPHAVTNGNGYSLGPHVTSDLARFTDLVVRSRATDDTSEETDLLRDALDLLRGQPFEGVRGYEWAYTEGTVVETEALIADSAHRLAQLALTDGDATLANWAATQGLMAVPGSEPLYRDRMEAAHLNGDPAAVDRIVEELCRYVETLDPLDDLHPDTVELWQQLGRRPPQPDGTST